MFFFSVCVNIKCFILVMLSIDLKENEAEEIFISFSCQILLK